MTTATDATVTIPRKQFEMLAIWACFCEELHVQCASCQITKPALEALSSSAPVKFPVETDRALDETIDARDRAQEMADELAERIVALTVGGEVEEVIGEHTSANCPWRRAIELADQHIEAEPCVIGKYCHRHGFIHGAEAEELRKRIEGLITGHDDIYDSRLRDVLDDVDARDSLALLEAAPAETQEERPVTCSTCRWLMYANPQNTDPVCQHPGSIIHELGSRRPDAFGCELWEEPLAQSSPVPHEAPSNLDWNLKTHAETVRAALKVEPPVEGEA